MANGDIGKDMAQQTVDDLLEEAKEKRNEATKESHCEDHQFQIRVNYAMLLGLSAILHGQKMAPWLSAIAMGVTAGAIIGISKVVGF